jgi:DNA-binding transcriptional MerR regulator
MNIENETSLEILREIRELLRKQTTIQKIKGMAALSIQEVQEILPFGENQIRYYAAEGLIPARKLGRHWIFSPDQLKEWLMNGGVDQVEKNSPRGSKRLQRELKLKK